MKSQIVSVVIPLLDEEATLRTLVEQVGATLRDQGREPDIVMVDDGSRDGSWQQIEKLALEHPRVRGIRFRRNFGKAAALAAGFEAARGPIVITMDADLQDDPREIPRFLAAMDEGFDVVSGWKKVRHDPWHKVGPSRVFNWLVGRLTGVRIHDHNCGFKAYRREIFDQVKLYGEMHRFVPVLADARGWRVTEIEVLHHPRQHGRSKYGVGRIIKGFLDLLTIYFLTRFSQRPLHLIGTAGLASFLIGGFGLAYLTLQWCVTRIFAGLDPVHLHQKALFYYCILAILLGAQLLVAGLLAELMTAMSRPNVPPYSIAAKTTDFNESIEGLPAHESAQENA